MTHIRPGDRVVVPFNISCGSCWMCSRGLFAQCETTQNAPGQGRRVVRLHRALRAPSRAARPSTCGSRRPTSGPSRCPRACPTSASSTSPTSCPPRGRASRTRTCPRAAPSRCSASARSASGGPYRVPPRTAGHRRRPGARAAGDGCRRHGVETIDLDEVDDVAEAVLELTGGRRSRRRPRGGRHGGPRRPRAETARRPSASCRRRGQADVDTMGVDRLAALTTAIKAVRRGGTVSVSGVYGGESTRCR